MLQANKQTPTEPNIVHTKKKEDYNDYDGGGDDEGRQLSSKPMWMRCDPRCECESVASYIANHEQFYFQSFGFISVSLNRQRKSSSSLSLLLFRMRPVCTI